MTVLRTGLHGHSGPGVISTSSAGGGAAVMGGGWWDDFGDAAIAACAWAAYQPKNAGSLAASYLDLTGNGNNCGPGVAPGWNPANGWVFNSTNQWLDSLFVPAITQAQSMLVQYTAYTSVGVEMLIGVRTGGGDYFLSPNYLNVLVLYANGVGSLGVAPGLLAGNVGLAGNKGYRNGIADAGVIPGWGAGGPFSVYIGCWNQAGVATRFSAVNIQAVALYDCTLTAPQMAAIAANMAAI